MAVINTSTKDRQQTLVRLKKFVATNRFLRWWINELSNSVPDSLRQTALGTESFAVVRLDQGSPVLSLFDNERLQEGVAVPLQALDAAMQRQAFLTALDIIQNGQRDVVIALASVQVLRKTIMLPVATEENLRQVLEFQMEEHTPFPLSQIYFGHRVASRDFARGQLAVEFAASPRVLVDEAVKTLNDWGCVVQAVVVEDMLVAGKFVNLLPRPQVKPRSIITQGLNPWLAGLVVLLSIAAVALPLLIKREAVVQMTPWLEKARTVAEATDVLRRDLEAKVKEHNYLLEKRQAFPPVIMVMEELTRILPDDTWVQQLDIKGKELQIQGETASSVKLIGLFGQSAMFYEPSFRSPLTKGQNAGAERFQLAVQMRPMAASPTGAASIAEPVPVASSGAGILTKNSLPATGQNP